MKDRQPSSKGPQQRIFLISALLHWMAIPAIVYLRSGFGFSFLSPKSIFLACCWAQALFTIYSWMEPSVLNRYWAVAGFGTGAALLYLLHLVVAVSRETLRSGEHDFYAGTSHILRFPGFRQFRESASFATICLLWIEPIIVFVAAAVLRTVHDESVLSPWLMWVAAAMWMKELINYWYRLRHEKKERDIYTEAEEKMASHSGPSAPAPSGVGRKPKKNRPPNVMAGSTDGDEFRFAQILRLMPPASIQQAEANYRQLIKELHPDADDTSPEGDAQAAELNEAIAYFRRRG